MIYIVENNQYAMGTSVARSSAVLDMTLRCAVPTAFPAFDQRQRYRAHGQDNARSGQSRRAGEGPTFIDAQTYRYKGHSISDPGKYRHKEELESAMRNDPILVYEKVLKERGWIDQEAIDRMHESVKEEVEESIEFAEQSEPPAMEALYEDITVAPFIRRSDHGGS